METERNQLLRLRNGMRLLSFLGMAKMWPAKYTCCSKYIMRGMVTSPFFPVDHCYCVQMKTAQSARQWALAQNWVPERKQFLVLCFCPSPCKWRKFPCTLPMLLSLGVVVNIQESCIRQMCFCFCFWDRCILLWDRRVFSPANCGKHSDEYVACPR